MTIKRRLFISNLLMTVVPFLVSSATMLAGISILNLLTNGYYEIRRGGGFRAYDIFEGGNQIFLIAILILFFFCAIVITTNRLLTKYVFQKITQPLQTLSDGVQNISEGNLDFRISHTGNDEFRPISDAFNNMAEQLKLSIEEVQKNEQNRKELFAGISHDLRSPLTSIKALVEGLIDGVAASPEAQQKYLMNIKNKTEDINNTISQLFLYSKMDMGNYPTNPEKIDIGAELQDFVKASQYEYEAKGLKMKIVGTTFNVNIYVDPLQLRSVFVNLLDNSAKYKTKETVTAKITCMATDNNVHIIFEDNGPGVLDEALPQLFEVFYRTDPSRQNPHQGSGLGLAIARKSIERMDGEITAENIAEGGLRMIIKIPIIKEGQTT